MGNTLDIQLEGKYVVLNPLYYKEPYVFLCQGGFGCDPNAIGNCVGGVFIKDGEHARVEGWQILRLATEQEVNDKQVSYETLLQLLHDSKDSYVDLKKRFNKMLKLTEQVSNLDELIEKYDKVFSDDFITEEDNEI